jgi:integral membrane sensor domain MASE1
MNWLAFDKSLERLKDVFGLIVVAASISTAISATIGVAILCLGGVQPWSDFGSLWSVWWLGDAMGVLVVAPVLLTTTNQVATWSLHRAAEAALLALGLVAVGLAVFNGRTPPDSAFYSSVYTVFPFVIWAAVRFGQRGTTIVTLLASIFAIWGALHGAGPFGSGTIHERLMSLQIFLGIVAVTGLLLAAALAERRRDEQRKSVLHSVAQILAESSTLSQATPQIIQSICNGLAWQLGDLASRS